MELGIDKAAANVDLLTIDASCQMRPARAISPWAGDDFGHGDEASRQSFAKKRETHAPHEARG